MGSLNMIWVGDVMSNLDNALMLLNSIEEKGIKPNVKFWCQRNQVEPLQAVIKLDNVQVSSIELLLEQDQEVGFEVLFQNKKGEDKKIKVGQSKVAAEGVYKVYEQLKGVAPVAAKDLIAQYLMWREDGLFLDTTMKVEDPQKLMTAIANEDESKAAVPILMGTPQAYFDFTTVKSITNKQTDMGILRDNPLYNYEATEPVINPHGYLNNLECWALRSTKSNRIIFSFTLSRLLRYWEALFFNTVRAYDELVSEILGYLNSKNPKDGLGKRYIIGGTIIYSMYDALNQFNLDEKKGAPNGVEAYCWEAKEKGGIAEIHDLGVTKHYQNSWFGK
jgi:hypothetical protein